MTKGLSRIIAIALVLVLGLLSSFIPIGQAVRAATSAQVTVTATGAYVSFTANASAYNFGTVAAGSTTNSSGEYIAFTNGSTVSTNTSVRMLAAAWTGGWTHSDSAAGADTAAMKANSSNTTAWSSSVFVKFNTAYNEIAQGVGVGATICTGLSLLAPLTLSNGNTCNNTVMYSFYQQ